MSHRAVRCEHHMLEGFCAVRNCPHNAGTVKAGGMRRRVNTRREPRLTLKCRRCKRQRPREEIVEHVCRNGCSTPAALESYEGIRS